MSRYTVHHCNSYREDRALSCKAGQQKWIVDEVISKFTERRCSCWIYLHPIGWPFWTYPSDVKTSRTVYIPFSDYSWKVFACQNEICSLVLSSAKWHCRLEDRRSISGSDKCCSVSFLCWDISLPWACLREMHLPVATGRWEMSVEYGITPELQTGVPSEYKLPYFLRQPVRPEDLLCTVLVVSFSSDGTWTYIQLLFFSESTSW
jgi:hypothetical protein